MNKNEEGYLKGEVCNRDGCKGVATFINIYLF